MKVSWQVEDGYAGGRRPQYTEISDDELGECGTAEEAIHLVESVITYDFDQKISWSSDGLREKVEQRWKQLKSKEKR